MTFTGRGEPRRRAEELGFTLPEVLITIVILGILLGIATSSWFGVIEGRRVDSAATQVLSDLRLAHTRSTNQLAEYRFAYVANGRINCAGNTDADYCLLRRNADGTWGQAARYLPERTVISGSLLNVDSTISTLLGSPGARTIKFVPSGAAESGGGLASGTDIRVTVASEDGAPSTALDVNPVTSRTSVV